MPLPTEKQNVSCPSIAQSRLVIMANPKGGKSTFLAQNPDLLLIDCDNNGAAFIDCYRVSAYSWQDLQKILAEIAEEKKNGTLKFKTIGLDTINGAYQFCRTHVLKELKLTHESDDKGFGRSWDIVKNTFLRFIAYTQSLGLGLWMTSHTVQKEVKIDGVKRTVTTTNLSNSIQTVVQALADHIIYFDANEDGTRTCYVSPQDGLETGGRFNRFGLNKNIKFNTEAELYQSIMNTLAAYSTQAK
jgi:hypothetical protein